MGTLYCVQLSSKMKAAVVMTANAVEKFGRLIVDSDPASVAGATVAP